MNETDVMPQRGDLYRYENDDNYLFLCLLCRNTDTIAHERDMTGILFEIQPRNNNIKLKYENLSYTNRTTVPYWYFIGQVEKIKIGEVLMGFVGDNDE